MPNSAAARTGRSARKMKDIRTLMLMLMMTEKTVIAGHGLARTDQHLVGVLNVRDICCHPRNERGGGELVDVCEGEVLGLKVRISS